jgi:hypothetical protein
LVIACPTGAPAVRRGYWLLPARLARQRSGGVIGYCLPDWRASGQAGSLVICFASFGIGHLALPLLVVDHLLGVDGLLCDCQ